MRTYVRFWINEWDLKRAYPDYFPKMEVAELHPTYEEDRDLEVAPEAEATEGVDANGDPPATL